jgi:hypothetical protein
MSYNNVLYALKEGAVQAFIQYVQKSQPELSHAEQHAEVTRMLRLIDWSDAAIAQWLEEYLPKVEG